MTVFYLFSDPQTAQLLRGVSFDPNAKGDTLATDRHRHTIFVRTFPVIDFTGAPSIISPPSTTSPTTSPTCCARC